MMMGSNSSSIVSSLSWVIIKFFLLSFLVTILFPSTAHGGNFYSDFNITWGPDKVKILEGGNLMTLSLDNTSGSAFITYSEYLFGKIDMQMKLVPGNSAGTVTTLYLSALGLLHDEIDFEFLGNETGQPYTIHTNLFAQGKGDREMQFRVWFDPTADFHTYTILWNPLNVIWLVDGVPIRVFKNNEKLGIHFPKDQPMKLYSSLWSADDWATQGGRVKTNWALAPFTASYRYYNADVCFVYSGMDCQTKTWYQTQVLFNPDWVNKMQMLQNTYMVYNYCIDFKRFPQGVPPECNLH